MKVRKFVNYGAQHFVLPMDCRQSFSFPCPAWYFSLMLLFLQELLSFMEQPMNSLLNGPAHGVWRHCSNSSMDPPLQMECLAEPLKVNSHTMVFVNTTRIIHIKVSSIK